VNWICIGQRNCGDANVSGGTLARIAPQQIRFLSDRIFRPHESPAGRSNSGGGAGGSHELMEEALQSINKIEIKTAG
jgi:hypothetical protein